MAGQLRQRLNVNPQRMVIISIALELYHAKGSRQDVVCLAASHDVVMRYVQIAKKTKLDVVAMQ